MTSSSAGLHEPFDELSAHIRDRHRAWVSLQEELEAIDWYEQRIEACDDAELARILAHNRDEEKEHAVMVLEWLRRDDEHLDACLRLILFSHGPIASIGEGDEAEGASSPARDLGVGRLTDKEVL